MWGIDPRSHRSFFPLFLLWRQRICQLYRLTMNCGIFPILFFFFFLFLRYCVFAQESFFAVMRCSAIGFCTLCFCFPTKMLHQNAPFLPLKCSVSPKKGTKFLGLMLITQTVFKINFKVFNIVLTVNTYKNEQD